VSYEPVSKSSRQRRPRLREPLALAVIGAMVAGAPAAANAATSKKPTAAPGFKLTKLAAFPNSATNCDDLALLDGNLFIGCQNNVLSNGVGGPPTPKKDTSTLLEYTTSGKLVKTWTLTNKIDGLGADPLTHKVIVTLDEDANSRLVTITPSAPTAQQVTNYTYSPDPRGASTPPALKTGGGTDTVTVDTAGHILIAASHAGTITGTATFKAVLTPPSSPGATGTAALSPTFLDNATATNALTGASVPMALGDVDSATIVPPSSPKYAGQYVVTDQTKLALIFAKDLNNGTGLTYLPTQFGLDDLRWATANGGTMYVVDKGPQLPLGIGSLYKITGKFVKGGVYAANDGVSDQVVRVNLVNGKTTPIVKGLGTSKGLVYVDPSGAVPGLSTAVPISATASATASATSSGSSTTPASSSTTSAKKKSSSSSNTGLIIGIIVVVLLVLAGGGYAMSRRRTTPS
jgi:hypothetical protein